MEQRLEGRKQFKFQSDSINTFHGNTYGRKEITFKFQSDSINTVFSNWGSFFSGLI